MMLHPPHQHQPGAAEGLGEVLHGLLKVGVDSLPRQSRDQVDTMGAQGEELTYVDKTLDKSSNMISDISSL